MHTITEILLILLQKTYFPEMRINIIQSIQASHEIQRLHGALYNLLYIAQDSGPKIFYFILLCFNYFVVLCTLHTQ
jgi:hypothetical protein